MPTSKPSLQPTISDRVTNFIGSWPFIITQSIVIILWIVINTAGILWLKWDPYPFIFLNLALSFQAAYTAPIIMMSQNRQNELDRNRSQKDLEIDTKAEMEVNNNLIQIKLLEKKILELEMKIDNEIMVEKSIPDIVKLLEEIKTKIEK
jgi:uncharacterized membrane protein